MCAPEWKWNRKQILLLAVKFFRSLSHLLSFSSHNESKQLERRHWAEHAQSVDRCRKRSDSARQWAWQEVWPILCGDFVWVLSIIEIYDHRQFHRLLWCHLANLSSVVLGTTLGWTSPVFPKLAPEDKNIDNSPLSFIPDDAQLSWIGSLVALGALMGEKKNHN